MTMPGNYMWLEINFIDMTDYSEMSIDDLEKLKYLYLIIKE